MLAGNPTAKSVGTAPASGTVGPEGVVLESGPLLAPANAAGKGAVVDGVGVNASSIVYHIHTHLAVYVDGAPRAIPYGIGMVGVAPQKTAHGIFANAISDLYWLHTHAQDGIIHIESPTQRTYYLGQFFAVWGEPLSRTQVGPAKGKVTAFVDGKVWTGALQSIPLAEHEEVQLDVGTPVVPFHHVFIPNTL